MEPDEQQPAQPQPVQFHAQADTGSASHDFGADWVAYAMNTEAPSIQGVDPSRNPQLGGVGEPGDGGTAYG